MSWDLNTLTGKARPRRSTAANSPKAAQGDPGFKIPSILDTAGSSLPPSHSGDPDAAALEAFEKHIERRLSVLGARGMVGKRGAWKYDARALTRLVRGELPTIDLTLALAKPGIFPPSEHDFEVLLENASVEGSSWTVTKVDRLLEEGPDGPHSAAGWDDGVSRTVIVAKVTLTTRGQDARWRG